MFGYILAGVTAAIFGGIALHEVNKPTGEKLKKGDSAFVEVRMLRMASGITAPGLDDAALQAFLGGLITSSVKVVNCEPQAIGNGQPGAIGTIVGFPKPVAFPLTGVTSIERNGKRIT